MKKILFTTKSLEIGGIETTLLSILKNIDYTEYEVDLLLMDAGILLRQLPKEVNVIYYQDYMLMPHKFLYGLKKNIFVRSLYDKYRFVFKKKYDVAIAFNGFDNYMDMVAASVKAKKKIIWVHNDLLSALKYKKAKLYFSTMWNKMSKKYKYFDKIVCVSKYTEENFKKMIPKYRRRTICINNLVDGERISNLANKKTTIKLGKEYNIVAVGRLTKPKNFDKLIDIHHQLIENGYNVRTYIIGDGAEMYSLSEKIKELGISNTIMLMGELENPYNVISQADLLVSLSNFESFGNVLLEAMILDVPFVSTITSGSKDIYENIMPKNGGKICKMDELYYYIIKSIKGWQKHIPFDYHKYNENILEQINVLLEKEN